MGGNLVGWHGWSLRLAHRVLHIRDRFHDQWIVKIGAYLGLGLVDAHSSFLALGNLIIYMVCICLLAGQSHCILLHLHRLSNVLIPIIRLCCLKYWLLTLEIVSWVARQDKARVEALLLSVVAMAAWLLSTRRVEIEHTLGHLLCILSGLTASAVDCPSAGQTTTCQGLSDVHGRLSWDEVTHVQFLDGWLVLISDCSHVELLLVLLGKLKLLELRWSVQGSIVGLFLILGCIDLLLGYRVRRFRHVAIVRRSWVSSLTCLWVFLLNVGSSLVCLPLSHGAY